MADRIFNFSAGPAVLPVEVLEEARENLLSLGSTGIGIMEHSHRGKAYEAVHMEAENLCRELAGIPENYKVLFIQGGASMQLFGGTHQACSSKDKNYSYIPATATYSDNPVYVHFTSNNTIFGTQWKGEPAGVPGDTLICDASSDIFSRPIDVAKYGLIYAGAQKNLGPSGVTVVIIRDDLIERGPKNIPAMLQYRTYAADHSLYNTPPTFGIYVMGLVFKWIKKHGGLAAMAKHNEAKAGKLYSFLDSSKRFKATAAADSRSLMNVTFVTGDAALDDEFIATAKKAGLDGLKGHRSVGGMRASIYNAFPPAGVDKLVSVMAEFEAKKS
jgi:phosphoserine aminotransferase